jgi:hypothetical protein
MMRELGKEPSAVTVAEMYGDVVNAVVIEESDHAEMRNLTDLGLAGLPARTVMKNSADQRQLARTVVQFAQTLRVSLDTARGGTGR